MRPGCRAADSLGRGSRGGSPGRGGNGVRLRDRSGNHVRLRGRGGNHVRLRGRGGNFVHFSAPKSPKTATSRATPHEVATSSADPHKIATSSRATARNCHLARNTPPSQHAPHLRLAQDDDVTRPTTLDLNRTSYIIQYHIESILDHNFRASMRPSGPRQRGSAGRGHGATAPQAGSR